MLSNYRILISFIDIFFRLSDSQNRCLYSYPNDLLLNVHMTLIVSLLFSYFQIFNLLVYIRLTLLNY